MNENKTGFKIRCPELILCIGIGLILISDKLKSNHNPSLTSPIYMMALKIFSKEENAVNVFVLTWGRCSTDGQEVTNVILHLRSLNVHSKSHSNPFISLLSRYLDPDLSVGQAATNRLTLSSSCWAASGAKNCTAVSLYPSMPTVWGADKLTSALFTPL